MTRPLLGFRRFLAYLCLVGGAARPTGKPCSGNSRSNWVLYVARSPSTILKEECGNASSADGPIGRATQLVPFAAVRACHRLAGCLASARQALQGSTRSDFRGTADMLSKAGGIGSWLK